MAEYTLYDGGSTETVDAESMAEARDLAREWVADGDWGEGRVIVDVRITGPDAESESIEVAVGDDPPEPGCGMHLAPAGDGTHAWGQATTRSLGGARIRTVRECSRCGCREIYESGTHPGEHPRLPARTRYEVAE